MVGFASLYRPYFIEVHRTIMIHVCSLAALPETVRLTRASHVLTVMGKVDQVQRPASIRPENHLKVSFDDITEPMDGFVMPSQAHVAQVLDFVRAWDRGAPLVIHCWAGVSRSTAAAFIAACALRPHRDEAEIAHAVRANSPTATPNARLVALADAMLGRNGRMIAAIEKIGRGHDCFEGAPFALELR